jgi:hypothetical protein
LRSRLCSKKIPFLVGQAKPERAVGEAEFEALDRLAAADPAPLRIVGLSNTITLMENSRFSKANDQ